MQNNLDFSINPQFSAVVHKIGLETRPVIIIDDFMQDPLALKHFAVASGSFTHYVENGNYYPGIRAQMPENYFPSLLFSLREILLDIFDAPLKTRREKASCCFSLTTTPPQELTVLQRLPHFDSFDTDFLAILHYLCDESHGGTAFYRHRQTGYESLDRERIKTYWPLVQQELVSCGEPAAEYISTSTNMFEQTASFSARPNRLLIYRGKMLHAGIIPGEHSLVSDPAKGRLTANTFLSFPVQ